MRFPWIQFIVWLALIGLGIYLAYAWRNVPGEIWYVIALPVCAMFGVVHFIRAARR